MTAPTPPRLWQWQARGGAAAVQRFPVPGYNHSNTFATVFEWLKQSEVKP